MEEHSQRESSYYESSESQVYITKTEAKSNVEVGQCLSSMEEINRHLEGLDLKGQDGSKGGSTDYVENVEDGGAWRCYYYDKNGVKGNEETSIIIPKYELDDIIKEESISKGSSSTANSLVASLSQVVETYKKETFFSSKKTETSSKSSESTAKKEAIEKLRVTLKSYRNRKVSELITRSDFGKILELASRYEKLTQASVSYVSRLSMYRAVAMEGTEASIRVKMEQEKSVLLERVANEKQKNVEVEYANSNAWAKRGDMLKVKIFGLKQMLLKLEAEQQEVDMNFEKSVASLRVVLEEASKAREEYHVTVHTLRKEQATVLFSSESIEGAETVWIKFCQTL